nr:rod shape-determining protein [Sphingorhabdus sp. EL138]
MDFGTANTIVHVPSRGAILNEPSDVGIETICGVKRVKAVETTILLPSACPI